MTVQDTHLGSIYLKIYQPNINIGKQATGHCMITSIKDTLVWVAGYKSTMVVLHFLHPS